MRIENIPKEILGGVRQRLGAKSEKDTAYDFKIKEMTPKEIMEEWSAWEIGDRYWSDFIISNYEEMKAKEKL